MRLKREILVLPVTAAFVLLVDQFSKHTVATKLVVGQSLDVVPWLASVFRITHVTNTGVAFGLFPGWGNFFVIVSSIVAVMILAYYWYLPAGQLLVRVALGLQFGGAIGNLVDRLRLGFVVDFIDLNFWPLRNWPIFNFADSAVVAGVTLLALLMLWEEQRGQDKQRVTESG